MESRSDANKALYQQIQIDLLEKESLKGGKMDKEATQLYE